MPDLADSRALARKLAGFARRRARDLAPLATLVLLVGFMSEYRYALCGEIDLSIASVAMMTGVVSSVLSGLGLPDVLALAAALAAATAMGLLNGLSTTRVGLPS